VDPKVSWFHCQIVRREGSWYLKDMGNRNQTWLGEQTVDEHLLADGDPFRIGSTYLTFRVGENPTETFSSPLAWS